MIAFVAAGFDPIHFWKLTPRELEWWFAGAEKRMIREHNEQAWHTWHIAALSRQKKMPSLNRLLIKEKRPPKRRQTWQEQAAIMESWAEWNNKRIGYGEKR